MHALGASPEGHIVGGQDSLQSQTKSRDRYFICCTSGVRGDAEYYPYISLVTAHENTLSVPLLSSPAGRPRSCWRIPSDLLPLL